MSNVFEGGKALDGSSPDATVTGFDRQVYASLQKVLLLPDDFKDYLTQWFALNQQPISAGNVLGLYRAVPRSLANSAALTDVVSTAAETTVISQLIPAGSMGASGAVVVSSTADYLNNSASVRSISLRVKFGGSTLQTYSVGGITTSTDRYATSFDFALSNRGEPDDQILVMRWVNFAAPGFGVVVTHLPVTAAIDTSAQQLLEVTIQHSASNASLSFRNHSYSVGVLS